MPNTQSSMWISQSSMPRNSCIKYPVVQHAQSCLDPRYCTSATSWIDFLIAIWRPILVMIKTNGKNGQKLEQWMKSGTTRGRIWAYKAHLAVDVTFYFPRYETKKCMCQSFPHRMGYQHKPIIYVVFMTMCMNVAKEHIFIYRWNMFDIG